MPELRPFYDVIVVGAGSAGAVVAQTLARLLPAKSILVIESGPDLHTTAPVSLEPANSPNLFVAQSDGRRQQPPQAFTRRSALGSGEAQVPTNTALHFANYVQGRGWGGSGAINGLVCAPGHPADYNRWAQEYGCTGWSWADIGPVLTALQSQLFISTPSMLQAADHALIAAHALLCSDQANGLHLEPVALALHQPNQAPSPTDRTTDSTTTHEPEPEPEKLYAFYPPSPQEGSALSESKQSASHDRENHKDGSASSTVGPITSHEPTALSTDRPGEPGRIAHSTFEPAPKPTETAPLAELTLLPTNYQASSEAPAQTLPRRKLLGLATSNDHKNLQRTFDIEVVRILTEGTIVRGVRLADGTAIETNRVIVSAGTIGSPSLLQRSGIGLPSVGQNLHDHTSVSVTLQLGNPSPGTSEPPETPERSGQTLPTPSLHQGFTPTNVVIQSSDHIQILPVSPLPDDPSLGVWIASPFQAIHGRGSVTTQPDGTTRVQFNSFSDERDRAQLRQTARLLGQLLGQLATSPNVAHGPKPVDPFLAEQLRTFSNDDLDTWVLNNQGSYYHAAGTCRMGTADDPRSVVDPTCAVLGWSNISVIDASIFPNLPMANPYLPTVAIAKLAANRLATRLRA